MLKTRKWLSLLLAVVMCVSLLPGAALAAGSHTVYLRTVEACPTGESFDVEVYLVGYGWVPTSAQVEIGYTGASCTGVVTHSGENLKAHVEPEATFDNEKLLISYYGPRWNSRYQNASWLSEAEQVYGVNYFLLATYTFTAGEEPAVFTVTDAFGTEANDHTGMPEEITIIIPGKIVR